MTSQAPTYRHWEEQVYDLGIDNVTIDFCEIEGTHDNKRIRYVCEYPPSIINERVVYNRVYRYRTLPDERKIHPDASRFSNPKIEDCPNGEMPLFYTPNYRALQESVEEAGGTMYLCEGDRDTMNMFTAGVYNTAGLINATGGININLVYQLKQVGVRHVIALFDLDHAGWEGISKLQKIFEIVDVQLTAKAWDAYLDGEPVNDLGDVWQIVNMNPARLIHIIENLKELKIHTDRQIRQESELFTGDLANDIAEQLGLYTFTNSGWSKDSCACPMHKHEHDNTNPAFFWNQNMMIGRCFKCGETWLAKDVAKILDIDLKPYIKDNVLQKAQQQQDKSIFQKSKAKHNYTQGAAYDGQPAPPSINTIREDSMQPITKEEDVGDGNTESSQLQIAHGIIRGMSELPDYYGALPDDAFMVSSGTALDRYIARIMGHTTSLFPPIMNPMKTFHHLGGNGKVLAPPVMVGILGISGGFKTSFVQAVVAKLMTQGYHGIIYSPEWDPDKHADRFVQGMGGLKMWEVASLERYYYEQRHEETLAKGSKFGKKPEVARLDRSVKVADAIKNLQGKVVYLNQFGANVLEVLAMIQEAHRRMTKAGTPPSFLIFDYAQLALKPNNWPGDWTIQDTVTYTKVLTIQLGLVTFMTSQVRKSDTASINKDNVLLDSSSGLYLRDDQFNFFLTINPIDLVVKSEHDGKMYQNLKLAVTKNSNGAKADNIDTALDLFVDLDRMLVVDAVDKRAEPLYYILEDDQDLTLEK